MKTNFETCKVVWHSGKCGRTLMNTNFETCKLARTGHVHIFIVYLNSYGVLGNVTVPDEAAYRLCVCVCACVCACVCVFVCVCVCV